MNDFAHPSNTVGAAKVVAGDDPASVAALADRCMHLGDYQRASRMYATCISLGVRNAAIYNNLGAALIRSARVDEAIDALVAALDLQPDYPRALVNLGKAYRERGSLDEARVRLDRALIVAPGYVPALINLADVDAASGDTSAALRGLDRVIGLAPRTVDAHSARGMVLFQIGRTEDALSSLRVALSIAPEHADVHSNLAHVLFCEGCWRDAWPHFEYRFSRSAHRVDLRAPAAIRRWDGLGELPEVLWLIGEQGLGDQIQFARYAALLADRGVTCVLACEPNLVHVLSAAPLSARVVPLNGADPPPYARWMPLMSVPAWHRTDRDRVPMASGYLAADPARVDRWRQRLPTAGLRVALAWAGNPRMETGRHAGRSPPLTALAPLLDIPGVTFMSLQKGPGEEQLADERFSSRIQRFPELDPGPGAFVDTAAILKCVDLLVTSDSAIAHLAGGLGVPCWLCLTSDPDWRWMRNGNTTPWYDSLKLFRQAKRGDWTAVYKAVARELAVRTRQS